MLESEIKQKILLELGSSKNSRMFNNPVGVGVTGKFSREGSGFFVKNGRPVTFGLCPGSGDLIGIKRVTITKDMVGKTIGQFVSCEVKTKTGKAREKQLSWQKMINLFGGLSVICRSVGEAKGMVIDND